MDQDTSQDQGHGIGELLRAVRRLFRSEGKLVLGILALLLLTEVGLRLVRPDLAGLVYSSTQTGGHAIVVNDQGLRLSSATPDMSSGTTVLGLGDSTTFGTGVGAEETWPFALDNLMGGSTAVHNAGFVGASLNDITARYATYWAEKRPPAVTVLIVTGNMISFTDHDWDQEPTPVIVQTGQGGQGGLKAKVKEAVQSSTLWKALSININNLKYATGLSQHTVAKSFMLSPLLAYGWQQPDLPEDLDTRIWQRFETRLIDLSDVVRDSGSCLVIGFLPPRFLVGDGRLDNLKFVPLDRLSVEPDDRVAQMASALNVPFVNAIDALRDAEPSWTDPLFIPNDYTHLSARGHDEVAQTLATVVQPIISGERDCAYAQ